MKEGSLYAVLTGDLIRSSRLTPKELKLAREALLDGVDQAKRWKKGLVLSKAEFFRGDSWQLLLSQPGMALRVALFLRARMKAQGIADTRIAIGIGAVDEIARQRVSLSSGEAFILSGQALDHLTTLIRMTFAISPVSPAADWIRLAVQFCDAMAGGWKPKQAEVVSLAINPDGLLHEQIAHRLKPVISKQATTKALRGAHWHYLLPALQLFENTDWKAVVGLAT